MLKFDSIKSHGLKVCPYKKKIEGVRYIYIYPPHDEELCRHEIQSLLDIISYHKRS